MCPLRSLPPHSRNQLKEDMESAVVQPAHDAAKAHIDPSFREIVAKVVSVCMCLVVCVYVCVCVCERFGVCVCLHV